MFLVGVLLLSASAVLASSNRTLDVKLYEAYRFSGNQYFDDAYLVKVTFGSPPQEFKLLADTGSPDTWVAGSNLNISKPPFRPSKSGSFRNLTKPWRFEYGGPDKAIIAFAEGYAAQDTVALPAVNGKTLGVKKSTFAVGQRGDFLTNSFENGVFGLAHDGRVSSYNAPVFMKRAIDSGLLKEPRFGVHLRRAEDAKRRPVAKSGELLRPHAGTIRLGDVDESKFTGPITHVPIQKNKGFWQIAIDGIYVNNKLVKTTRNFNAILDTGASILVLPPKLVVEFYNHLGGTREPMPRPPVSLYTVPCDTRIDIKVKIGGVFFPIKAQDVNNGYKDNAKKNCFSKIIGADATNASKNGTYPSKAKDVIVLGVPLLANTYSIFDYSEGGRVGLARLKNDGKLPTIAPIDVAARKN